MEMEGRIIAIRQKRTGTSKDGTPWATQEYVLEDNSNSKYIRKMCFEVFGDERINQFKIQKGEHLKVHFDIDAREWNDRWFNSIRAWRIERFDNRQASPQQSYNQPIQPKPSYQQQQQVSMPQAPQTAGQTSDSDDLPF